LLLYCCFTANLADFSLLFISLISYCCFTAALQLLISCRGVCPGLERRVLALKRHSEGQFTLLLALRDLEHLREPFAL
jgi:hypothetical protein